MPALSPTMTQGNIARWKVKEGDEIRAGDSVAEIETDKATMEFESQEDGFLAKIVVGDGAQNVPVGAIVAVMVEDDEDGATASSALLPGPELNPGDVLVSFLQETGNSHFERLERSKTALRRQLDTAKILSESPRGSGTMPRRPSSQTPTSTAMSSMTGGSFSGIHGSTR